MDDKVLRDHLRRWELETQLQFHKAEIFINSLDDVSKWMAEAPQWLDKVKQKAEALPEDDPKRKELKTAILRNITFAQARHKANNPIETRVYIAKIEADWENVNDNLLIEKHNKKIIDNSIRGKKPKLREWAVKTADFLNEKCPNMTREKAWLNIPESFEPLGIPQEEPDYEVYREDKNLIAVNEETGKESTITKETFFKNYFKKGMKPR